MPDAAPRSIHAKTPGHEYDILVRPGLLHAAGLILRRLTHSNKAAVITDSTVGPLHADTLSASLTAAGFSVIRVEVPAGEDHKILSETLPIFDRLLRANIDRSTPIIALGGGVVGDVAGFVAATILRGVPFLQVPTSLLAMVDASVGGKTGVNHPAGKNLIGAFHQPIAVLIDPAVLKTLPPRELRGGLAECIKHDIIRDAEAFSRLERDITKALALDLDYLCDLIAHNVAIKAKVVEADPKEKGERAHLNFGHTFGHAIEHVSQYQYSHGESIALGMVAAAALAHDLGMIDDSARRRIIAVIEKAGLPVRGVTLDTAELLAVANADKKVKDGRLRFVLPDRIGHVVIRDDIPAEKVRAAFEGLRR